MRRIYQDFSGATKGLTLFLNDDAHHHLFTVLRCHEGEEIILFNGQGESWHARITQLIKKSGKMQLLEKLSDNPESSLPIHLAQAISKGDRMDFIMQKATELGVTSITPIISERCHIKLDQERWEKKTKHWQQIIIHACEQCGRNTLPILHPVIALSTWLTQEQSGLKLILSPKATQTLTKIPQPDQVTLLIGPEGGLSQQEIAWACERFDFQAMRLGPRVLRTETAAVAALSVIQYEWGDLGHNL